MGDLKHTNGISIEQLKQYLKSNFAKESKQKSVDVTGATLEEAIENASIEFGNIPVNQLDYEILEKGKRGVFGVGAKKWHIKAYLANQESMNEIMKYVSKYTETGEERNIKHGKFYCYISKKGYMLKVSSSR